jgi:hypothetical protein
MPQGSSPCIFLRKRLKLGWRSPDFRGCAPAGSMAIVQTISTETEWHTAGQWSRSFGHPAKKEFVI